ncbi:ThiF family adenylyltransferase [Niveibacterium sp. SC-1]|uniref:ThiF family adenylyltransferase n=1 Tax=Niveibacterium sp. SC-1 TaxID=3135646 RepID=UPI00311EFDE3
MNAPIPLSGFARPEAAPVILAADARRKRRLQAACVLIVGTDGLNSALAQHLAAAGVGTLGFIDLTVHESPDTSRVVRLSTAMNSAQAAAFRLAELNPHIRVQHHRVRAPLDARAIFSGYHVVADASDSFDSRLQIEALCARMELPNVNVTLFRHEGLLSVFGGAGSVCSRCLCPHPPAERAWHGAFTRLPATIGALQAAEVVKLITGAPSGYVGKALRFDITGLCSEEILGSRNADCPVCGALPAVAAAPVASDPTPGESSRAQAPSVTAGFLRARLISSCPPIVLDVRTREEARIATIPYSRQIPLYELESRIGELDPHAEIVCYCHSGMCSEHAVRLLMSHGFSATVCLRGGLEAWLALAGQGQTKE